MDQNISSKGNMQMHVHEFYGSTELDAPQGRTDLLHNHRFAGMSGPTIQTAQGHIHEIVTGTDFYFNHYHCSLIKINVYPVMHVYGHAK